MGRDGCASIIMMMLVLTLIKISIMMIIILMMMTIIITISSSIISSSSVSISIVTTTMVPMSGNRKLAECRTPRRGRRTAWCILGGHVSREPHAANRRRSGAPARHRFGWRQRLGYVGSCRNVAIFCGRGHAELPVMSSAQAPQGGRPLACGEPKSAAAAPTRAPDVSWGRRAPPAGAAGRKVKKADIGRDGCDSIIMMMMRRSASS